MLIICSIGFTVALSIKKDDKFIKGGGFEFLVVILFGTIISYIYSILSVQVKTETICYLRAITKNLSFSLIFATILIKILRIYVIYNHPRHKVISRLTMYSFIFSIAIFHLIVVFLGYSFGSELSQFTVNNRNEQIQECVYPTLNNLSEILNISILVVGAAIAYLNRNTEKIYNEKLTLPIYVYIMCYLLTNIIYGYSIPGSIKIYFESLSIIFYTLTIIYYLYVRRILKIVNSKSRQGINSNSRVLVM
eukprot:jgi/Orpsp1_1/1186838/evm.model.d7180000053578.1